MDISSYDKDIRQTNATGCLPECWQACQ